MSLHFTMRQLEKTEEYKNFLKRIAMEKEILKVMNNNNNKTYEQGLEDAWKAAKKIVGEVSHGGFTREDLQKIFGEFYASDIMVKFTPAEAIAKIKAYEDRQKTFECGDVLKFKKVTDDNYRNAYKDRFIFINAHNDDARVLAYGKVVDKVVCVPIPLELLEKTGEHINIKEILK